MDYPKLASEFHFVMNNVKWSDAMYKFLLNIYHLYPEDRFHLLLKQGCTLSNTDESIYRYVQKKLPSIKPFMSDLRFALPALLKQKQEMMRQTLDLLDGQKNVNGYLEIGSLGRYGSVLRKQLQMEGAFILADDLSPGFSLPEMLERGQLGKLGTFQALDNYAPLNLAAESLDLVTCYIGLHHIPLNRLEDFTASIAKVLRPGGRFILRDHDVTSSEMNAFICNIHSVFNLGLGLPWEQDKAELRHFRSINHWVKTLDAHGLIDSGKRILQDQDPSMNYLLCFIKGKP